MIPLIIFLDLLCMNVLAFCLMGWDKRQAKRQAWRQSEQALLLVAAAGGSLGTYLGMRFWRHKTQKERFRRPFFMIVLVQAAVLVGVAYWWWG
jgi:uncharacterized membrane protein YsdA (DUF1294 family)